MKALIISLMLMVTLAGSDQTIYQFSMKTISGEEVSMEAYRGKVLLIVNVASKCGNTPQYKDLQALYEQKKDEGLVILGFPANDFGRQEPGTDAEIMTFCEANYGVTFPMFSKISVKGDDQHPLYTFLTRKEFNGYEDSNVRWNFQKYLIDKNGKVSGMIAPGTSVMSDKSQEMIAALLGA